MNTTLAITVGALLLGAPVLAQASAAAALQRALLIEQQEGDLRLAEQEYRALLTGSDAAVGDAAALHLGSMLWRLGRRDEGRDLLQRAANAGGEVARAAQAVLQDPDPDGKQAEAVAQKVRELLAQFLDARGPAGMSGVMGPGSDAEKDLKWLGVAAVPELLRQLEGSRAAAIRSFADAVTQGADLVSVLQAFPNGGVIGPSQSDAANVRKAQRLAELVWEAGGPAALAWLQGVRSDSDLDWRRLIASACARANDSLLPVVEQLLADSDPTGDVQVLALVAAHRLPLGAFLPVLESPVAAVRARAWTRLTEFPVWRQDHRDDAFARVLPVVQRALSGKDPATTRAAFSFLQQHGAGTPAGMEVLLDWLPRVPTWTALSSPTQAPFASVLRCAKALGRANANDGLEDRRRWLLHCLRQPLGKDATAAGLLDLAELGYSGLLEEAIARAKEPADLVRAASLLRGLEVADYQAAQAFAQRDLPANAYPDLAARLQMVMRRIPAPTKVATPSMEQQFVNEAGLLFTAIGRTGNPEAVALLRQAIGTSREWSAWTVESALQLADRAADADVLALLRELLVIDALDPYWRNLVFAELAEQGDTKAIPLFPRAYALGLVPSARQSARPPHTQQRRGVQWLATFVDNQNGEHIEQRLHGYDEAGLHAALLALLDSDALPAVLVDLQGRDSFPGADIMESVVARLPELLKTFKPQETSVLTATAPSQQNQDAFTRAKLVNVVGYLVTRTPTDDSPTSQRYRTAVVKLLGTEMTAVVADSLNRDAVPFFADALRAMLAGPQAFPAFTALSRGNTVMPPSDVVACLQNSRHWERPRMLGMLPVDLPAEVARAVESLVSDADEDVREAACHALGRSLRAEAVAVLLPALRDPQGGVRKAAAEALERIRLYHEQKVYWEQFQQGVTTGRDAATGKLLLQGKPDQPKAQRLLAIEALGALGAPEASPLLIEWSNEADAEIAAAARKALARIVAPAGK